VLSSNAYHEQVTQLTDCEIHRSSVKPDYFTKTRK